jgi:hypothetical protein
LIPPANTARLIIGGRIIFDLTRLFKRVFWQARLPMKQISPD